MRCRECAAEVAVTARVCSRCGAPIVGQPPVVADTVTDTVAVRLATPRSATLRRRGDLPGGPGRRCRSRMCRVRATGSLRRFGWCWMDTPVLLLACSLLLWPAPRLLLLIVFFGDLNDLDDDLVGLVVLDWRSDGQFFVARLLAAAWALGLLKARTRFSTLLRRPSDPRTATVMASKRGGRTLILDIPWDGTGRGYQPLSEVHLALWMKAGMLVPGERVTVYGGPGGESPLLISSAQRGRAFLGTMKARSTVQPGPVAPLDERVSGATLVDWAAWAAATTFSYTGLGSSYDKRRWRPSAAPFATRSSG